MAHRSPARIIAPLALAGAVVATILVVQASTSGGGDSVQITTQTRDQRQASKTTPRTQTTDRARGRTYTVKPGDILSNVSEQTGVSIARLQELNPGLDAQALQVGQKIKLAADAQTDQAP